MKAAIRLLVLGVLLFVDGVIGPYFAKAASPQSPSGNAVVGRASNLAGGSLRSGATVRIVELGRMVITDSEGRFVFENVPEGTFTLGAHMNGFSAVHLQIVVPLAAPLEIELFPKRFEDEVTVTATPFTIDPMEACQQVDIVAGNDTRREGTASLGQALASVPGVANIPTGGALGTPVIRGLSENRVRVLNDGLALNHQQFSWRHSPNVEASLAERVEVVRGPASVLYGPDAMGGVINLIQPSLLVSEKGRAQVHGELAPGWGSNADERSGRAEIQGALGAFGFNLGLVRRTSGDIQSPNATLNNTDFEQTNGNLAVGVGGKWGTARVRWNYWELDTGFYRPVGFRLGLKDELVASDVFLPTAIGDVEVLAGRQVNLRKAFPQGTGSPPAVDLELVTESVRVGFHHRAFGGLRGRVAIEHVGVDGSTGLATDLLPVHETGDWAVMLFEEARFLPATDQHHDRVIVSAGARWDSYDLSVDRDLVRNLPDGFEADYHAITGSLGTVWRVSKTVSLAANLGRGWRPPSTFELFAKGVHGGVSAVQSGNPNLVAESNLNTELSLRLQSYRARAYVTAFRSECDDFIYLADTGQVQGDLPVFTYRQDDATIQGVEALIETATTSWLRLGASYSIVRTENRETNRQLPQEPAGRLAVWSRAEVSAAGPLRDIHADLELVAVGGQEVSGPDEPFGVPTDAYELVNLKVGADLPVGDVTWGLDLSVRNLFNTTYTDFLYSYKAVASNPGRDVRLVGRLRF